MSIRSYMQGRAASRSSGTMGMGSQPGMTPRRAARADARAARVQRYMDAYEHRNAQRYGGAGSRSARAGRAERAPRAARQGRA